MSALAALKEQKRAIIDEYAGADNRRALWQVLNTLVPLALLWWLALIALDHSGWLAALVLVAITLFTLRALVLMHECGHGSLFTTRRLNRAFGFVFGVVASIPQYVWSQHHGYHHAHNGNWEKYRGPLTTPTVQEFIAMGPGGQRRYRRTRHICMAPFGGFVYLILNPRLTWIRGSLQMAWFAFRGKRREPEVSWRVHASRFRTRYWNSAREYRHMSANNLVLLPILALLCFVIGPARLFLIYLVTVSAAGAIGIILFTVQHNFDHAYAVKGCDWDYDEGALHGTSYLVLPVVLQWFTANIGFHHVHHLSDRIPNYRLEQCHRKYQHLFTEVRRIRLQQVPASLKCLLWDQEARCIISLAEFQRQSLLVH